MADAARAAATLRAAAEAVPAAALAADDAAARQALFRRLASAAESSAAAAPVPASLLAPRQLVQLKAQLKVMASLSRRVDVSPELLALAHLPDASADAAGAAPPTSHAAHADAAREARRRDGGGASAPFDAAAVEAAATAAALPGPAALALRLPPSTLAPPPPTPSFTPAELRAEAQRRLAQRIAARVAELDNLPQETPAELRVVGAIERKGYALLDAQRALRAEVAREAHVRGAVPAAAGAQPAASAFALGDLSLLRRGAPFAGGREPLPLTAAEKRDADFAAARRNAIEARRAAEARLAAQAAGRPPPQQVIPTDPVQRAAYLAAQQAAMAQRAVLDRQLLVVNARRRFCSLAVAHAADFRRHFTGAALRRRRLANDAIAAYHGKGRAKLQRVEQRRLQALRANDEEGYAKLVAESKNERLNTLLSKTAELLSALGDKIKATQAAAAAGEDGVELVPADGADGADGAGAAGAAPNRAYASSAHAIQELVSVQPAMLVGPQGDGKLRGYQLAGLQWMVSLYNNNLNGILADEMGLGKTIQTIGLLAYLYERKGLKGPHLIVCPKAVLPNWAAEFAAWAPDLDVILYDGRPDERAMLRGRVLAGNGGRGFCALLTHYDLILRDKAVLAKPHWSYIIVDEGHRMKNHESRLAEVLAASYRSKHRLLLTGTPIQNNMGELWALLNFLLPAIFHSAESFQSWFNAPFAGTKEDINLNDEEELVVINRLHAVLRPFLLRRRKAEVESQLPAKVEVVLKADMSAWQRHYYKSIVEEKRVETSAGGSSLMNGAMQLRKCCNHPYLFLAADGYEPSDPNELIRASGKLELLHRILPKLKASGHRVLLFSQMTSLLNILEDYLAGRGYSYLRLDGNTGTAARAELLASFNAPDSPHFLFLLSTRAGGMGLNLQSADTVIMFDSDWNPQADAQAEDRAHRIGQRREVRVIVMVSVGSIEEVILARARAKRAVDAKVIQAGMFNGRSSADERRALLAQIFSGGGLGGRGLDGASVVTRPAELNALIARSEEEVEMFDAMDAASPPLGLITQEELPEWVTAAPARDAAAEAEAEAEAEALATGVRRKRQARQGVTYADGLSDAKWLKIVDSGGDADALKLAADRSGKRRRSGSRRRSSRGDGDDDTPPAKRGRRGSARRSSGRASGRAAPAAAPPPRHGRATRANAGRNGNASASDGDESDDEASGSESESGSGSGDESGSESGEDGGAEEEADVGTPTPAADASPE